MRCQHCGGEFEAKNTRGRFCSSKCRAAAWRDREQRAKASKLAEARAYLQTATEALTEARRVLG